MNTGGPGRKSTNGDGADDPGRDRTAIAVVAAKARFGLIGMDGQTGAQREGYQRRRGGLPAKGGRECHRSFSCPEAISGTNPRFMIGKLYDAKLHEAEHAVVCHSASAYGPIQPSPHIAGTMRRAVLLERPVPMHPILSSILVLAMTVLLAAPSTAQNPPRRKIEDLRPEEVEVLVKELETACRRAGVDMRSIEWDRCIRREGQKRGYV
jgi:hypothetical protein